MIRRRNNRRKGGDKRPTATLDLKAETVVSENSNGEDPQPDVEPSDQAHAEDSDITDEGLRDMPNMQSEKTLSGKTYGSFFHLIFAALIGGGTALAGNYYLTQINSSPHSMVSNEMSERLTALDQKYSELVDATKNSEITSKLALLEKELANAQTNKNGIGERLVGVEKTIDDLALAAKGGDAQLASVAAIAQRVNGIEVQLNREIAEFKGQYRDQLKGEVEIAAKTAAVSETIDKIDVIRTRINKLGDRLSEFEVKYFDGDSKIRGALSQVENEVKLLRSDGMTSERFDSVLEPLRAQIGSLTERLTVLSQREAESFENARRSALALAFANLKRSLDRGMPFGSELSAVRSLADKTVDFRQLEQVSASGVPTEKSLLEMFPSVANRALQKGRASQDGTSLDKLLNKARATFKYRRTGDIKGDTSEAILARMEHKFRDGHTEAALEEFKNLPELEASVVGPWSDKLRIRLMIEREMHLLENQLLKALSPR